MVRNFSATAAGPGEVEDSAKWPKNPKDVVSNDMDTGALVSELANLNLLPGKIDLDLTHHEKKAAANNPETLIWALDEKQEPERIEEGTYRGTQLALAKVYDLIEQRYVSFMDLAEVDPVIPSALSKEDKRNFFVFTDESDDYPPHLNLKLNAKWAKHEDPNQGSDIGPFRIFNWYRLLQLKAIMSGIRPKWLVGTPDKGKTIKEVEDYNRAQHDEWWWKKDIFDRPNVGDLNDWYSDARFAQQHFTGTNPTTIELASDDWIDHFIRAAKAPEDAVAKDIITKLSNTCRGSLYIQDYSYFRKAAGMQTGADIKREFEDGTSTRYGCASVCLFYLNDEGQLYPLAIVTDWRGSLERSVTIYNRELFKRTDIRTGDKKNEKSIDEAKDWPWRYAKTCVQTSDWFRHEVTTHLVRTHMVEEAIIISANRQLPPNHPVFRILRPHWQKTLALNAAARTTLVPEVILNIVGFEKDQATAFIRTEYNSFDFENSYVPKDLRRRGFPPEELNDKKFHNYAYARCINSMWNKIRKYVEEILALDYTDPDVDQQVEDDEFLDAWCREMRCRDGANLPHFPRIKTFQALLDCVTMAIHLASPQHTAVNYLQDYYQCFVINKPSCLFAKPPDTLEDLLKYKESHLVEALPMNQPHEWLLSSHVPYLLSFKPKENETLMGCIYTMWQISRGKNNPKETDALHRFYDALFESRQEFERYAGAKNDSRVIPYKVLEPEYNAVSILI